MAFTSSGSWDASGPAGYGTIDDTSTELCNDRGTSVWIKCRGGSSNSIEVNIPLLTGDDYWFILDAGDAYIGRFGYMATIVVNAKAADDSDDADVSWSINAKMSS